MRELVSLWRGMRESRVQELVRQFLHARKCAKYRGYHRPDPLYPYFLSRGFDKDRLLTTTTATDTKRLSILQSDDDSNKQLVLYQKQLVAFCCCHHVHESKALVVWRKRIGRSNDGGRVRVRTAFSRSIHVSPCFACFCFVCLVWCRNS